MEWHWVHAALAHEFEFDVVLNLYRTSIFFKVSVKSILLFLCMFTLCGK